MVKKFLLPFFLFSLAYLLFYNNEAQIIIAGIAIFLIGMIFMEDGFKFFSGGFLQKILKKSTNTLPKAIFTGFLSTTLVQSSSLISIITISFLSAKIMTLISAIGIIFGSNIGSTTTAWIISYFGMKIDIAKFAMPMLIFGVIFKLLDSKNLKGLGNMLLGLGFVFLGIEYMKDGFQNLSEAIDLSKFAMDGMLGVMVYVLLGMIATVIIQSSAATMALIITALATQQIVYINAIELAIGANIGTTITAIVASLASNSDGKRLAVAHLVFNLITAFVAIILILPLISLVDILANKLDILEDDYALKLALFHTIFNILGVILVTPFINKLVSFLENLFKSEKLGKAKSLYLNDVVIKIPDAAINSIKKENIHLLDNAIEVISHALFLHRHKFLGVNDLSSVIKNSNLEVQIDVNEFYSTKIKQLYSEIVHFSTLSQENMSDNERKKVYELRTASRDIVEAIKDIRELQKNLDKFLSSNNENIKEEYNNLRLSIAKLLKLIFEILSEKDEKEIENKLTLLNEYLYDNEVLNNENIDSLIRMNQITSKMATSLINDTMYTQNIQNRLGDAVNKIFKTGL